MSEQFFTAITAGELPAVEAALDRDPDLLLARSAAGLSPVLAALYYNEPDIADLLITRGAPLDVFEASAAGRLDRVRALVNADPSLVNAVAPDGFGPLGLASFFGREAVADFLLERGADPNTPSSNAQHVTPLHSAAAGAHAEIVVSLLARGADPNARQSEGFTALHSAAQNDDVETARMLLAAGADPTLETDDGRTALDIARTSGSEDLLRLLE